MIDETLAWRVVQETRKVLGKRITMKRVVLICAASLCLALTAKADVIPIFATYKNTPESTDHIVSVASNLLGEPNLLNLLRLEDLGLAPAGSPFSVTYPTSNTENVSWNLSGTGFELVAIYIFGGSNGANLYKIPNLALMISGSTTIHPPVTGNSGQFADISHTLFLGIPVPVPIPEPCTTSLLSVGAISLLLRKLRRR